VAGRSAELAAGLDRVNARIRAACESAGRDPAEVTLVVVTKTYPVSDVQILADLGVRDVGENRDQEAAPKAQECADLGLDWHFIGQLQSNKARSVARYAGTVHSLDRRSLVAALGKGAHQAERTLRCFLQINLDEPMDDGGSSPSGAGAPGGGSPGARGGLRPGDVPALAAAVAGEPGLELAGVMAVAPLGADPDPAFARLLEVSRRLRETHPAAAAISAGMSGDLEAAVRHGATHLRVGSAVLGERPPLR
jgi:uncharacterized pyridoxal phosphate-containing UPF0001 family protein